MDRLSALRARHFLRPALAAAALSQALAVSEVRADENPIAPLSGTTSTQAAAEPPASSQPAATDASAQPGHPEANTREVQPPGTFLDLDGKVRAFQLTYDDWFGRRRGDPHYWVPAIENAGVLAIGLAYYWINRESNRADWDRPSIKDRFTLEAVRFDNNSNLFNHILHPFAGANYYGFARVNNLTILESSLYALSSSVIWEFGMEWRELVSLNDIVFTQVGGVAVGEFLFQLGEYFTSATRPNRWQKLGAYTIGAYRAMHNLAHENYPRTALPEDALGFSSAFWHRFRLAGEYVAIHGTERSQDLYGLRGTAELVTVPGFARPGRFGLKFKSGDFSEGDVDLTVGPNKSFDVDLWFSSTLAGGYRQDYSYVGSAGKGESAPRLYGYAAMLGLNTAFRFSDHSFLDRRDQVAIGHAAGPQSRLWFRAGRLNLMADLGFTADFAAIRSLAFEDWRDSHDVSGVKTVLQVQNYQYHFGYSGRGRIELNYAALRLGANASFGLYDSIEGLDRKEEEVTADLSGSEGIFEIGGFVSAQLPGTLPEVRLAVERYGRYSTIADLDVRRWDTRTTLGLGVMF